MLCHRMVQVTPKRALNGTQMNRVIQYYGARLQLINTFATNVLGKKK